MLMDKDGARCIYYDAVTDLHTYVFTRVEGPYMNDTIWGDGRSARYCKVYTCIHESCRDWLGSVSSLVARKLLDQTLVGVFVVHASVLQYTGHWPYGMQVRRDLASHIVNIIQQLADSELAFSPSPEVPSPSLQGPLTVNCTSSGSCHGVRTTPLIRKCRGRIACGPSSLSGGAAASRFVNTAGLLSTTQISHMFPRQKLQVCAYKACAHSTVHAPEGYIHTLNPLCPGLPNMGRPVWGVCHWPFQLAC